MADIEYKSTLDDSDVIKALDRMEKKIDSSAKNAERSFERAGKAADKASSGIRKFGDSAVTKMNQAVQLVGQLGSTIQAAGQLIEEAIAGNRIEKAFQQLAANAGQSGDEILDAITKASNGTISKLDAMRSANTALQFGVAKTPEEFEKMTRGAIALGRALGVSTNKALEDFTLGAGRGSVLILDNLGISAKQLRNEIERLAQEGFGKSSEQLNEAQRQALFTEAALSVLNDKASELGTNMADVGASFDQAKAGFENLKQEGGELLTIFADLAFGGSGGGKGIFQQLADGATAWQGITLDVISILAGAFEGLKRVALKSFEPITLLASQTKNALTGGGFAAFDFQELAGATSDSVRADTLLEEFRKGLAEGTTSKRAELGERFKDLIDPEAVKKTGEETGEILADSVADGIDSSESKAKIKEATERLAKEAEQTALELQIRQERRFTDQLIDNAREREDIARDNAQAIADIQRDSQQDIADAAKDLSRDEQQIARDGARRQSQIARDEANSRLDIERDFRQQLEQIRRTFEQSAIEAERANDAIAFTRAVRQRDNSIADATSTRDNNLEETRIQAQQQREALRVELRNELEDARIANRQKLEDLRERLNRELEEQRIKNQRDLEEQAIVEARKEADRLERDAREIADFERQQAIKLERLNDSLKKEFEAILAAEKAKTAIVQAEAEKQIAIKQKAAAVRTATVAGQVRTGRGVQQFASGGVPPVGRASLVGERGPELFVPNTSGRIIPNSQLFSPPALRAMAGNVTNINNNGGNANVSMTPDLLNDPIMKQRLIEMVTNEIAGSLR